jgi:Flp pilus assembly pilin Flp
MQNWAVRKVLLGQSIIEYAVLLMIVAMAVGGMKMYLTRSVKAQFKVMQDQVSGAYDENDTIGVPDEAKKLPSMTP